MAPSRRHSVGGGGGSTIVKPTFTKAQLQAAFAHYRKVKDECSDSGDWKPFARLFTEDAYYVEHAYGEFFGRAEIERYIVAVMEPFPTMRFVETWITLDEEHGAIIWELHNVFPPPNNPATGKPFSFPNMSRLVLDSFDDQGRPLFSEVGAFSYKGGEALTRCRVRAPLAQEQDWYNPSGKSHFHAGPTTKAWRNAGGKFLTKEKCVAPLHIGRLAHALCRLFMTHDKPAKSKL